MSAILLAEITVWLDGIFVTLWFVVLIGIFVHFLLSIPIGRFRKKFILHQWPAHEGEPAPFITKFLHFQHVAMMIALAVSGLYIHFPFFDGGRTIMRWVHYVAMVIVILNYVWRVWYAFFSRRRDYRRFAVGRRDIESMFAVVKYYAYLADSKPHVDEFNVMQKLTYNLFAMLMVVQAFTGLALITDPILFGTSFRELIVGWWLGPLVGGTAMAGAWMRLLHYVINWLFIILTTVHMYLAASENLPLLKEFFGGKAAHGHGDAHAAHGHGHGVPAHGATAHAVVEAE